MQILQCFRLSTTIKTSTVLKKISTLPITLARMVIENFVSQIFQGTISILQIRSKNPCSSPFMIKLQV